MTKCSKIQDVFILLIISMLTLAAFYVSYALKLSGPIIAIIWIFWLVSSLAIAYFSGPGKAVFEFSRQAKSELQKVVWPSRKETVQTTIIVMVMVSIAGFVLWMADSGMMWLIGKITHLG